MKRVADVTNFAQAAERAAGGRDIFGGRSSADRKVGGTSSLPMYVAALLTSCLCLSVVSRSCTRRQGQHAPGCSDERMRSWPVACRGRRWCTSRRSARGSPRGCTWWRSRRTAGACTSARASPQPTAPPRLPARATSARRWRDRRPRCRRAPRGGAAAQRSHLGACHPPRRSASLQRSAFDSSLSAVCMHSWLAGAKTAFKLSWGTT